jgi:multisubunit Na+/H+ antiporter MnhG subunit
MKKKSLLLMLLLVSLYLTTFTSVHAQTNPSIKVEPELNVRSPYAVWPNYVDKTFEVNVTINDITSSQKLVAADFFLAYDKALLEVVSVTEGPFFTDPRWNLTGTFFISFIENLPDGRGVVKAMDLIYPNFDTGTYDQWTMFPTGSGTIATITFKAIYQPIAPQPSESCMLELTTSMFRDYSNTEIPHDLVSGTYEVMPLQLPRTPIDIDVDVGTIYFRGEQAEFNILTSDYGKPVDTTSIKAYLYYNGSLFTDLTDETQHVSTGLYRIVYAIPPTAQGGTYTLLVEGEFYEAKGTRLKGFLISPTLEGLGASVTEIKDNIATVVLPSLDQIKINLTAVNARVVSVEGTVATLSSTLGLIQTDVSNLKANVASVSGTTATLSTGLGDVNMKLGNVQSMATVTLYAAIMISILAVIIAVAILVARARVHL